MTQAADARSRSAGPRVVRAAPAREKPDGLRLRAWHAAVAASMAEDAPGTAPPPLDRFHAHLTAGATAVWTATRAGHVVGLGVLHLPSSTAKGRAHVHVHPAHRRRGVGDRLVTALTAEARARGLHRVIVAVPAGGTGDAFCLRRGMTRLRTLHHLLLPLRDVHPGWLDEMVAVEHPGYRLTKTARIARPDREDAVPGDVLLTVAAEHGRKVVGCTEVVVPGGGASRATQHDRPPADDHHGLGLDLWVKATMLRLLYDDYPQVTQVATDTVENDAALLAVNRHLGFRLHHRTNEYRLDVDPGDPAPGPPSP
ncbi:GNAT family N-acetyltransferase [Actinomadura algeriensis]|uniref:GNAT superfamily N-acetyltransferase n=1 Tax=Actinomadura algeriensis TaxID=1679523 RepID=A0ABR9JNJ6_9ACTN|nr:GNAT family N-acetyltransferase [Actinomadura algeriensis]MBE1532130.1 GNAT superfamily N-acetyltransferase [Actinomadura algeriensis]